MKIDFTKSTPRETVITSAALDRMEATLGAAGGGVSLEEAKGTGKRYITGYIELLEDHSAALMLRFFLPGAEKERMFIRFGLMPRLRTLVCFDLDWLDNRSIFTNRTPGTLKLVIHGLRTDIKEVARVELGVSETFHDVRVRLEDFALTDTFPSEFPLPDVKIVDEFGQWKQKEWPGKLHSLAELRSAMAMNEGEAAYPFPAWNKWGGDSSRKLAGPAGFFRSVKTADGRWHLVDPEGCDYFSLGPCCIRPGDMGRVDSLEKLCDWLPEEDDPAYGAFYESGTRRRTPYMPEESFRMFSFLRANLYKIYGDKWHDKWQELSYRILKGCGCNSEGNHSSLGINDGTAGLPYVRQIDGFPLTETLIFRDFPDVLSPEYKRNAEEYAKTLDGWKDDPWLIGYFLRNEPEFNFVPNLAIADEVLHNPAATYCRTGLLSFLRGRYGSIEALNAAWGSSFASFGELDKPIRACSATYPGSEKDIREYSVFLIREYIRVPAEACRLRDPNHMNLGVRWSKADNLDMMTGWEYFDVFSINCYSFDPTADMDFVKNAGVDLPILIGEFHCGALDRGIPATGLKGVKDQAERGVMWRYFSEKVAAHPYGVGAHWFQYNDQFCLGRFDGENYQIGMVDVCMQPHKELAEAAKETAAVLYKVKNGEEAPYDRVPDSIPMIGY